MRDKLEIGSVPYGEDCQQVGTPDYDPDKARKEVKAFHDQLYRAFPELSAENSKTWLKIVSNYHEFGTYREVAVSFDPDDDDSIDLAYRIESNAPEFWDDQAKDYLGLIPS